MDHAVSLVEIRYLLLNCSQVATAKDGVPFPRSRAFDVAPLFSGASVKIGMGSEKTGAVSMRS